MTTAVRTATPPSARAGASDRQAFRRLCAVLALLVGALTLLGPAAGATPRTAPTAADPNEPTITFGLTPLQGKDQPYRANFDLELTPGQEFKDSVRVRNLSGQQIKLGVYATDALNTENGAVDLLAGADRPEDLGAWITLEREDVTLASNDFIDIPFTLKVPTTASPGDHTAGIIASYVGEGGGTAGPAVTIDRRIGTRVLVRVAGTLTPKLVVSDLKTSWDGPMNPLGRGTTTVAYRVSNDGNVRMGATQKIKISSPIGFPATTVNPPQVADLLPGNSIVQTHKVDGVWPIFRSTTKVTVAPVPVREGDSFPADISASAKTSNWTFPWAFLIFAIVLFIGWKLWQRRQRQLEDAKSAELTALVDSRLGVPVGADANGQPTQDGSSQAGPNGPTGRTGL